MNISQTRVQDSGDGAVTIDERNAPPGLLESWADYHDAILELAFGPEPPLTEERS